MSDRDLVLEVKSVDEKGRITEAWVVNGCWTIKVDWYKGTAKALEGGRIVTEFQSDAIAESIHEALVVNSEEFEKMKQNCPVRRPKWRVS